MLEDQCNLAKHAATILLIMKEEEAVSMLKNLSPGEVQQIANAMINLSSINEEQLDYATASFIAESEKPHKLGAEPDYLQKLLTKSLGGVKSFHVVDQMKVQQGSLLPATRWLSAEKLWDMFKDDAPQIIAVLLLCLEEYMSSKILNLVPLELRTEVIKRVSYCENIPSQAVDILNELIEHRMAASCDVATKGGPTRAAAMLKGSTNEVRMKIVEELAGQDAEMAASFKNSLLSFSDIFNLDERKMRILVSELSEDLLTTSLKNIGDKEREQLLSVMPIRAAGDLRDNLKSASAVSIADCISAQKQITAIVWKLVEEGKIELQ